MNKELLARLDFWSGIGHSKNKYPCITPCRGRIMQSNVGMVNNMHRFRQDHIRDISFLIRGSMNIVMPMGKVLGI